MKSGHAQQATIVASLTALVISMLFVRDWESFYLFVPPSVIGTGVTTYLLWKNLLKSRDSGLGRAAWVGALAVVLSLFILSIYLTLLYVESIDNSLRFLNIVLLVYVFAGPFLIPLGALVSVAVRWRQLRKLSDQ